VKPQEGETIVAGALQSYMFIVVPRNGIAAQDGSLEIDFPNDVELKYDAPCNAHAVEGDR
jgi:hypothetical protein